MSRITNELESIGDSCLNLFLQIERLEDNLKFSNHMNDEITKMYNLVIKFTKWNNLFISDNIKPITKEDLSKSIKYEKEIDQLRNELLDSSRSRLSGGSEPKAELLFMDIIKHLEHIGDYSLNISQAFEHID